MWGYIYILYVEQQEICISLFITTPTIPSSAFATPSFTFVALSPASITYSFE
jgi:hypothetical protein